MPNTRPPESLLQSLRQIVGEDGVSLSAPDLRAYSRDMCPITHLWWRRNETPAETLAVIWPRTPVECARAAAAVSQAGISIIPYGAGSGVCGGVIPTGPAITFDLKRLRFVEEVDAISGAVRAGAGVIGQHLEDELNRQGFTLGHFPSSIYCSSVGGWIAARSAGQCSSRYGKIEDMVVSLRGVTPDGQMFETRSFYTPAPSPLPWLIGSEGTLAVIVSAKLRVHPLPEARQFASFGFDDVEQGTEAMRRIMQWGLRPSVVRLYDELDTMIAMGKGKDSGAKLLKPGADSGRWTAPVRKWLSSLRSDSMRAALEHPGLLNFLADRLPVRCLLILGFEGKPEIVRHEVDIASAECEAQGGKNFGEEPGVHWQKNRYGVSYKQSAIYESGSFVDTMEVATTWSNLMPLYRAVKKAVGGKAFIMAHFSHAYPDGCSIYFTFAGGAPDVNALEELYRSTWKTALDAVHAAGATISHHHGVGMSKQEYMPLEHGAMMNAFKALKSGMDAGKIMNPGKLGL